MPTNIKESKKINKQVIYIATFMIYILAFLVFELGYCNATNVAKLVSADFSNIKYNFSLCRIVMYIIFIITLLYAFYINLVLIIIMLKYYLCINIYHECITPCFF